MLLRAELRLEGGQDAGRLVDRAAAPLRAEDPARMAGLARHFQRPAVDPAPPDGCRAVDGGLEAERHVALARELEHRLPRLGERHARVLLVARQHDRDAPVVEGARRVQRLQGLHHHDHPALHVGRPGAEGPCALAPELLARQHGVDVAEQQEPLAPATAGLGDEVAGALHPGRQFDPARAETDRAQLLGECIADGADARRVLCRTLDVHDFLQQGLGGGLAGGGVFRDRTLGPVEVGLRRLNPGERQDENPGNDAGGEVLHGGFQLRGRQHVNRRGPSVARSRGCRDGQIQPDSR